MDLNDDAAINDFTADNAAATDSFIIIIKKEQVKQETMTQ